MKNRIALLGGIVILLVACNNFFHELVPPDGDRITSFTVPGQVRSAMISDDAIMVTVSEGTNVRSLLPGITASPRASVLPVTFNYLQTAFPSEDILKAAAELYKSDDPAAYIEKLVRRNKDFKVPALNIPIDFFAPVDVYVISARGSIRRYTVFVSVENENNPGGGIEWPRLLGMGFAKANNPCLHADALCWITEDGRTVSVTVRYMPDSGFSFALVPTFVIWGDRMELDVGVITSDESVIQFDSEPVKQSRVLTLWRGNNSVSYTLIITFTEVLGVNGPMLEGLRFAKYDNPELVIDAVCNINENSLTVNARAFYPAEMPYLSFALAPSFEILGERLAVDGVEARSGDETSFIQFNKAFGTQNKTLTVWRNGRSKDYTLTLTFEEDPDTVRSITDFRFVKQDNSDIAANAVASIVNTDNTGAITVQVFYSGAMPSALIPRFVSPGTVSVSGATQTTGASSHDFLSALEYRVVSRNGQFARTYTVRVEFVSLADAAPRITSFRFSQILNSGLVQDSEAEIHDDTAFIIINAYYGGTFPPEQITPEFSAEGLVQVMGGVQVSAASPQDFSRPLKYTVVHPLNSLLRRDYWVYTTLVQDSSSHAIITAFSFHPEDNPGLRDRLDARIDQGTGKISIFAPIGSGLTTRTMYPRFTAAGMVSVAGSAQISGASGQMFNSPVVYTVVSDNGLNRRDYTVEVRELTSTMYVNQNAVGSGDGTSWENAFRYLQSACEAAAQFPQDVPKEIWIAKGTYTPANMDDYFRLTPNTSYIGGFAGWETYKSQRNITANTVTVSGNLGGGVYARHIFAAVSELDGDLSFENLRLSGARGEEGACINASLDTTSEIAVTGCNFSDMQASGTGGAVYVRGGGAAISDSAFSACNNGAVYVQGAYARISDVEFSNCNSGNVVRLDCSGDTEIKLVNVADSQANAFVLLTGNGNKTLEAVTVSRGGQCLIVQDTVGYVRVNGLVMRDLTGSGIGMYNVTGVKYLSGITARNINSNNSSAILSDNSSGSFTLTGNNAFDNTGIITIINGSGAVSVLNTEIKNSKGVSALSVAANGNTVIDALNIDGVPNGRGITISSNGNTVVSNTNIKNCVTPSVGGGMYIGGSGSATISYTTITGCKAGNGGGMYLTCGGNVSVSNITIDTVQLTSSGGLGGGIYRSFGNHSHGNLSVENSVIKNITGTGIYYSDSANLEVSGLELQNISGNGIYSGLSGIRKFSGITATNIGGDWGVFSNSENGSFSVTDSTFNSCGVYCSVSEAVPITVTDTDIRNASGNSGLNVNTGNAAITIERVTIDGVPNGRGIYVSSNNTVMISNSTVKNCVTTGSGGGMYIFGSGIATISYTTITECKSAAGGGGMYISGTGIATISNTNIKNCVTTERGGGMFIYRNVTCNMESGTISGNTADSGGGVYVYDGSFIMNSDTISGNTADSGGGVYVYDGTFIMNGGTISNNNAVSTFSSNGGGVFIRIGTFTMNGGTISNNTADYGGGVYILTNAGSTMIKTGGTIYGSDGGAYANYAAGNGHAINGKVFINTTLGPSVNGSW